MKLHLSNDKQGGLSGTLFPDGTGEKKPRSLVVFSVFWLPDLDSNQGPAD
jgi:hypothetical protein